MRDMKKVLLLMLCCLMVFTGCKEEVLEDEAQLTEAAYLSEARNASGVTTLCYTNASSTTVYEVQRTYTANENPTKLLESIMTDLQYPETVAENELGENVAEPIFPEGVFGYAERVQKEETSVTSETTQILQVIEIKLREPYYAMTLSERVIMRTGLARSIFTAGLADRVELWAPGEGNDEEEFILVDVLVPSQRLIINQYSRDFYTDEITVDLYFSNPEHTALIPETHTLTLGMTDSLPYAIVQALINGPEDENLVSVMPQGTMVEDVFMKDGVCYVDLNEEFQKNHLGGQTEEMLTIYSIVNSLHNVNGINYIQFLVEGKKVEYYKSYVRLDTFLVENMDLVTE